MLSWLYVEPSNWSYGSEFTCQSCWYSLPQRHTYHTIQFSRRPVVLGEAYVDISRNERFFWAEYDNSTMQESERHWEGLLKPQSDTPLPTRPHVIILPSSSTNWRPGVQTYEPMGGGDIPFQTATHHVWAQQRQELGDLFILRRVLPLTRSLELTFPKCSFI